MICCGGDNYGKSGLNVTEVLVCMYVREKEEKGELFSSKL